MTVAEMLPSLLNNDCKMLLLIRMRPGKKLSFSHIHVSTSVDCLEMRDSTRCLGQEFRQATSCYYK